METIDNNTQSNIDELLDNAKTENDVRSLIKDREKLLKRKPFTRGGKIVQTLKTKDLYT